MTASDHAQQRPQRFPLPERGRPQMESRHSHRITTERGKRLFHPAGRAFSSLPVRLSKCSIGTEKVIHLCQILTQPFGRGLIPNSGGRRAIAGPSRYHELMRQALCRRWFRLRCFPLQVRKKAKACGIVLYGIVLGLVLAVPGCNATNWPAIGSKGEQEALCQLPGHCAQGGGSGSSEL